jgi:hypothetical protein
VFRIWRSADFQSAVSPISNRPASDAPRTAALSQALQAGSPAKQQIGNLRYGGFTRMNANGTRLTAITKELWNQWQQTKHYWKDARSEEFEQKYLAELVAGVDKTVTVIEQLDKLLGKIRRDCE